MRDPLSQIPEGSTDKFVVANTVKGKQKITGEQYVKGIVSSKPEICTPLSDYVQSNESLKRVRKSVDRSLAYLDQHLTALQGSGTATFGVLQGSQFAEERRRSAQETAKREVAGFSIEGLGCGEPSREFGTLLTASLQHLPAEKPRLLHGTVSPLQILRAVELGVDLFDGSYPLVISELGEALVFSFAGVLGEQQQQYKLNLWDAVYSRDKGPLVAGCTCYTCKTHTRAYVHHLLNTRELLAPVLLMRFASSSSFFS